MSIALEKNFKKETFQMSFINGQGDEDSCSSSSIGKNSDCLSDMSKKDEYDDDEVQSKFNKVQGAFDSLQALEHILPIRRGISSFYNGKSKSFACLSTASLKDIAKPDNAYARRRRNLMASASYLSHQLHMSSAGGIHKRSLRTSCSTIALGLAMSRSNSSDSNASGSTEDLNCSRSGSFAHLPPLHPN